MEGLLKALAELGIGFPTLLAQIVNFTILLGLLYLVAYRPVMRMLDERSRRVKESVEQTEQIKERAEQAEEEVRKRLEIAATEGQEIITRATLTGDETRKQAQQEAKQKAEALLDRAKSEIQRERNEAIDELRKALVNLTIMAAGKVIDRTLDKETHRHIIDKALEESKALEKS